MESIIELLLNSKLESKELIFWLNSSIQVPLLNEFAHLKYDFVPLFLNFLKDQTSSFLLSSGHTGLTPNKSKHLKVSKYISPSKLSRKPYPNRGFSSKAKTLDFSSTPDVPANDYKNCVSDSFVPHEGRSSMELSNSQAFPAITPKKRSPRLDPSCYESPVSFQSHKTSYGTSTPRTLNSSTPRTFNTSTPRFDQYKTQPKQPFGGEWNQGSESPQFNSSIPMSLRKNVLADYILIEHSKKAHKKKNARESPKDWNNQTDVTETEEELKFNIEDKEVFPLVGSELVVKGEQRKRRINPTRVLLTSNQSSNSLETSKSFGLPRKQMTQNVFLAATETKTKSLDQERKLLKEQKEKLQNLVGESFKLCNSSLSPDNSYTSSLSSVKSSPSITEDDNIPSLKQVTTRNELNILAEIYSSLILYNMVPNIMVEIYFLLQLLTVEKNKVSLDDSSLLERPLLNSCHNCVYFSIKTLSLLVDCLALFDRSFIRALTENTRVLSFDKSFQERLSLIMDSVTLVKAPQPLHPKSPILSVSFQSETDNRNNFPTTTAFQMFKKQRDLFYELLRIWEDSRLVSGWSFAQGLGSKVRQIMSLQSDPTNLIHLARLFQSQLLTMCKGDEQLNAPKDAEDISFLCTLKKQHPEKYKKLYDRLITPSKFGGPVPGPSFPGSQEFFRSFITVASNHCFNTHLKNVLVAKITEFNNLDWQILDIEEKEQHGDHLRNELSSTLQNLRLLAKYLGLLEFLPYQVSDALPDVIIANHLVLRNKVAPPIPLLDILKEGIRSGCLVVVIPWMVELLSMVDSVAFHTRYYLTLIFELKLIYKLLFLFKLDGMRSYGCRTCAQLCSLRSVSPGNSLFLKLLLGWLLSLPNVPEGLFYVHEEEADIDTKEYQSLKGLLVAHYTQLCPECASSALQRKRLEFCSDHDDDDDDLGVFSPIKSFSSATPVKNSVAETPLKGNGSDASPLKTPSKFLHVSMIDTPEVTPDKRGDEEQQGSKSSSEFILDSFNLIDFNILLMTCPFVHELKGVLHDFALGNSRSANGGSVRKITPLSAPDKVNETAQKNVQILLEENFFHNQPSSTKKAVDFIVERIFSKVLRSIRSIIIPKFKDGCVEQLRACAASSMASSPLEKVVEIIEKKVHQLSSELAAQTRTEIMIHTNEMTETGNLNTSLQFLLPGDVTQNSLEMCCKIVKNTVHERVTGWIISHLSSGFCTKELTTEVHKYIKQIQKSQPSESACNNTSATSVSNTSASIVENISGAVFNITLLEDQSLGLSVPLPNAHTSGLLTSQTEASASIFPFQVTHPHNEALLSPSSMLYEIKTEVKSLMLFSVGDCQERESFDAAARISALKRTLLERRDLTPPMFKAFETLSVDWMVALCVCRPSLITKEILRSFVAMWLPPSQGGLFPKPAILTVFLSARNIMLLGQRNEEEQKRAWAKLEEVLFEVFVTHKVLCPSELQEPFVSLMRHAWPQTILNGISCLVKNFVDVLRKRTDLNGDSDLIQFVDWVGWITAEMDHLEEDFDSS